MVYWEAWFSDAYVDLLGVNHRAPNDKPTLRPPPMRNKYNDRTAAWIGHAV